MSERGKVYLAGPEVFLPTEDNRRIVDSKKRVLEDYDLVGLDPVDAKLEFSSEDQPQDRASKIFRANRDLMDQSDAIIANLTPFRGVSADPGTVFEVGYFIGRGMPAFGFRMDSRKYRQRLGNQTHDGNGWHIENFELGDNLMIDCGIIDTNGIIAESEAFTPDALYDETLFEQCVLALARRLERK